MVPPLPPAAALTIVNVNPNLRARQQSRNAISVVGKPALLMLTVALALNVSSAGMVNFPGPYGPGEIVAAFEEMVGHVPSDK